jgi:segregation and condensation protein A
VRWTGGTAPVDRHSDDVDGAVEDPADPNVDVNVDEEYG